MKEKFKRMQKLRNKNLKTLMVQFFLHADDRNPSLQRLCVVYVSLTYPAKATLNLFLNFSFKTYETI